MPADTGAAFHEVLAAYQADPEGVARADVEAAAVAHVADVDPGYAERTGGLAPHDRIVAPDLKAAYDKALEAHFADPGDAGKARKAQEAGEVYARARTAARVADGRDPAGGAPQVHTGG